MAVFECGPIRNFDEEKRLVSAGAYWIEGVGRYNDQRATAWFCIIAGGGLAWLFFWFASTEPWYNFVSVIGLPCLLVAAVGIWMLMRRPIRREMLFTVANEVLTPGGLHHFRQKKWHTVTPSKFRTIEAGPTGKYVTSVDDQGAQRILAVFLGPQSVTPVVFQLNEALRAVREEWERSGHTGSAPDEPSRPRRVID